MKENLVIWECRVCGYKWKGKSPNIRETRPHCTQCGSWSVKVKDWLIDKERREKVRETAIKRAEGKCEACGNEIVSPRIHHVDYNDYYNPDKVVCLCQKCYAVVHKKTSLYGLHKVPLSLGIIFIIFGFVISMMRIAQAPIGLINVNHPFIPIVVGIALIISAIILGRNIRKTRKAVRRVMRGRRKIQEYQESNGTNYEANEVGIDDTFYCRNCGRDISERDFIEYDGLCKYCRGMVIQKGFPSPPGFPKM